MLNCVQACNRACHLRDAVEVCVVMESLAAESLAADCSSVDTK